MRPREVILEDVKASTSVLGLTPHQAARFNIELLLDIRDHLQHLIDNSDAAAAVDHDRHLQLLHEIAASGAKR